MKPRLKPSSLRDVLGAIALLTETDRILCVLPLLNSLCDADFDMLWTEFATVVRQNPLAQDHAHRSFSLVGEFVRQTAELKAARLVLPQEGTEE